MITIETLLETLARDKYGETAKKLCNKLSYKNLNAGHCLVIARIKNGLNPVETEYLSARNSLARMEYVHGTNSFERGRNNKFIKLYRLTEKGEAAHAEIIEKFTPVVARVNAAKEAGK